MSLDRQKVGTVETITPEGLKLWHNVRLIQSEDKVFPCRRTLRKRKVKTQPMMTTVIATIVKIDVKSIV